MFEVNQCGSVRSLYICIINGQRSWRQKFGKKLKSLEFVWRINWIFKLQITINFQLLSTIFLIDALGVVWRIHLIQWFQREMKWKRVDNIVQIAHENCLIFCRHRRVKLLDQVPGICTWISAKCSANIVALKLKGFACDNPKQPIISLKSSF